MIVSSSTRATWTSDFKGVEEKDQVRISYKKPKAGQRSDWTRIIARRGKDGTLETYTETDYRTVILQSDLQVSGLIESVDGKETEIKTGEQLLASTAPEVFAIVRLVAAEIMKLPVPEEREKN